MPRARKDIESDIAKEAALWLAPGNRLDALRKERRELDTPAVTGEVEAAEAKAEVDAAITEYQKTKVAGGVL